MDRELQRLRAQKDATMKKAFSRLSDDKVEKDLEKVKDNYKKGPFKEYGIFQSIIEADQAEAYKRKKQEEEDRKFKANRDREDRRAKADSSSSSSDDALRKSKAEYLTRSHMKKTGRDSFGDYVSGKDATNRHIRRHPELNECSIELI